MRTDIAPAPTRLSDYKAPSHKIESVYLNFDLSPKRTRVKSKLEITRLRGDALELNGENIELVSVRMNGELMPRSSYRLTQEYLIIKDTPERFTLEIETTCDPSTNSTLMGLYVSGGRFCTQCEAEGFRRITYYLDRPDALSVFTVRVEAALKDYPHLLANGNMIDSGAAAAGRHFAVWHDPFPKPCYLFALVAGEFDILEDNFTTMSGRDIPLSIFVDTGNAAKAEYAMDALKRSMKWDEEAFGREYDLDRFMVVAVRDFNFGAMENKGLNIFNSVLILAEAETATDMNFERIESVVAHEYFHNWTGNRITCRDWFQLCLKEGFTVYRDQQFSADQRGAAVQRIKDVRALRSRQFLEDGGPLAHPVRPNAYLKIDNFYTATIYEKGAELIRMLHTWLGAQQFRKASDLYFERLDGTAATIEQFIACFEDATGQDLSQFMLWYEQAGTPALKVKRDLKNHQVTLSQTTPKTPGQNTKKPVVIPIKWQAIGDHGPINDPQLSVLTHKDMTLDLPQSDTPYSLSILQDFSAPVILDSGATSQDLLRLMRHDSNSFNRWEAGQTLAKNLMCDMTRAIEMGKTPKVNKALVQYCNALKDTLNDDSFDNNFKALALTPPSSGDVMQALTQADPLAIAEATHWLSRAIGDYLQEDLLQVYQSLSTDTHFSPDAAAAGRRALKNRALALLASCQNPQAASLTTNQLASASNMTDELAALVTLTRLGGARVDHMMEDFFTRWTHDPLVIDKWFSVQSMRNHVGGIDALKALTEHPAYDPTNPNRARALIGGFAMGNAKLFHKYDGSGYAFFTDQVLDMDSRNPSIAERLLGAFEVWKKLDNHRQNLIQAQLTRIIAAKPSKNTLEIAQKTLG
ncbi:MAG: aminopeptidase N [Litorimonas sp.]